MPYNFNHRAMKTRRREEPKRPAWMKEGWRPMNGVMTSMDMMRFRALSAFEDERRMNRKTGIGNRHMMSVDEFVRHLIESTSDHRFTEPIVFPKKPKNKRNKKKKDVVDDDHDVSDDHENDVGDYHNRKSETKKNKKRKREGDHDHDVAAAAVSEENGNENDDDQSEKKKKKKKKKNKRRKLG